MPSAALIAMLPEEIAWIGGRVSSPRRMIAPLPKSFSICAIASSSAFDRSFPAAAVCFFFGGIELLLLTSAVTSGVFNSGVFNIVIFFAPPISLDREYSEKVH